MASQRCCAELARDWTLGAEGLESDQEARRYITSFDNGRPIDSSLWRPRGARPAYYRGDFGALNFTVRRDRLDTVLAEIEAHLERRAGADVLHRVAAVDPPAGFRAERRSGSRRTASIRPRRIWIGNRTIASCHYDAPNNIACVAVGRRRFTLSPPDQIFNLYPGPLDPTPGGQAVSTRRFLEPRFRPFPDSASPRRWRERGARSRRRNLRAQHVVASRRRIEPVQHAREYWWVRPGDVRLR